jgi:hypothetical protein
MADRYDDETPHNPQLEERVQKYIDAACIVAVSIAACILLLALASCAAPKRAAYYQCDKKCVPLIEKVGPVTVLVPR